MPIIVISLIIYLSKINIIFIIGKNEKKY